MCTDDVLHHSQKCGVVAVEKLLDILQLVVIDASASVKALMPSVIGLVLDTLYPAVLQSPSASEVLPSLFGVLQSILTHHWRYFFPASLAHPLSADGADSVPADTMVDAPRFSQLLEVMDRQRVAWRVPAAARRCAMC